jgi:DNA invertase Pin-like site-specific DNA recombinase
MRAAIYARVSRADHEQDPEVQFRRLREFAARRELDIYAEFHDFISGAASKKPALEKALKEARARHYDALLVVRLDRLARSVRQLLTLAEDLDRYGVALICSDQDIDTKSASGRFFFTVLGAVAEFELELIRERTRDGLARAKDKGKRLGRPRNETRDEVITTLRAQGLSHREIGEKLGMTRDAVKQRLRRARVRKGVGNRG